MKPCIDCALMLEASSHNPPHSRMEFVGTYDFQSGDATDGRVEYYKCAHCGAGWGRRDGLDADPSWFPD
jgi:hypothetical protein